MSKTDPIDLQKKELLLNTITDFSIVADTLSDKAEEADDVWRAVGTFCQDLSSCNSNECLQELENKVKGKDALFVYVINSEKKLKAKFTADFEKEISIRTLEIADALASISKQNEAQGNDLRKTRAVLKEADKKNKKENSQHFRKGIVFSVALTLFGVAAPSIVKKTPVVLNYFRQLYVQTSNESGKNSLPVNDTEHTPFVLPKEIAIKRDRLKKETIKRFTP